jgi:hypothetical protein
LWYSLIAQRARAPLIFALQAIPQASAQIPLSFVHRNNGKPLR